MMALPNPRKESIGDNWQKETGSPEELPQEKPDVNQMNISDQNLPELQTGGLHLNTVPTESDKAVLTDNSFSTPITPPPTIPKPPFVKQRSHPSLVLKVSSDSYVSVTVDEKKIPEQRKSVMTKGGRLVRNVSLNNSVKYGIDTAYNKYSTDFSHYNNVFHSNSNKQGERTPSLKRDGQVRRASRSERTSSERSLSTSSSEEKSAKGKLSTFVHQASTDSCTSVSSNTQLVANPYNSLNHKISSVIWCPCFFFFCFCCCTPAYWFMNRSDSLFDDGHYDKARIFARLSTVFYILGMVLSIAFFGAIFAVIIIFAT